MDAKRIDINFVTPRDKTGWPLDPIESLAGRLVGENQYEILETPYFANGLARGDVVSVSLDDGQLWGNHLVRQSGHSTVRVALIVKAERQALQEGVEARGCAFFSGKLRSFYAVNVPPDVDYRPLFEFLSSGLVRKVWEFEESALAAKHESEKKLAKR